MASLLYSDKTDNYHNTKTRLILLPDPGYGSANVTGQLLCFNVNYND